MFHSRFNRVLAAVTWLLCLAAVLAVVVSGNAVSVTYLPLIALVAWLTWAGLWRPSLSLDDERITVTNVFATTSIPWPALIQVDTHYALTLVTPHRRVSVTVAPAPGRLSTALSKNDMKGIAAPVGSDGTVQAGDLPSSDSGAAAHLVRQRWNTLLEEGRIEIGTAESSPLDRRIHWVVIAVSVVLAMASTLVLTLH